MKTFQIRLTRDEKCKNDDVLTVREANENCYLSIEYKTSDTESKKTISSFYLFTPDQAVDWLVTLLRVVSLDDAPFKTLQVFSPSFPCVLFNPSSLRKRVVRNQLRSMFDLTRDGWRNNYLNEEADGWGF
jgi:hypothetical protein